MAGRYVQYKVVNPFDSAKKYSKNVSPEFRQVLSKLSTAGQIFSPKNLRDVIVSQNNYAKMQEVSITSKVSKSIKIGLDIGVLEEHVGDRKVSDEFKNQESIIYWQSQLRTSKNKNLKKTEDGTTKHIYLLHLWNFNKWLIKKTFNVERFEKTKQDTFKKDSKITAIEDKLNSRISWNAEDVISSSL